MLSFKGKIWFLKLELKLKKSLSGGSKAAGFDIPTKSIMQMMGGFIVLRLTNMAGMMNVNFTKEELLKKISN